MRRLTVEVPATSANLGSGFDTLGLALDIVDTYEVEIEESNRQPPLLTFKNDPKAGIDPEDNLLCRAYAAYVNVCGAELTQARFLLESRIPIGKGLGSSAAAIVSGIAAAAHVTKTEKEFGRRLDLAARLDGHADNVAACLLGGLTTTFLDGSRVHALHVANHLSLGIGLFVPEVGLETKNARSIVPQSASLADAVFNLSRASYLCTALIWGRWELIGPAMQDRLHQPYRKSLIPGLDEVIRAAVDAGAYGAALSGAGPAVIALGPGDKAEVFARAMETRAGECGWKGHGVVTRMREQGVVVKDEPASGERAGSGTHASDTV